MEKMLAGSETPGAQRAMNAFLAMKKIDIAELQRAAAGRT
jgi:predicted 3-demethylubiquinone-9 3-methyltransferase (glyoxalase superfamily)